MHEECDSCHVDVARPPLSCILHEESSVDKAQDIFICCLLMRSVLQGYVEQLRRCLQLEASEQPHANASMGVVKLANEIVSLLFVTCSAQLRVFVMASLPHGCHLAVLGFQSYRSAFQSRSAS